MCARKFLAIIFVVFVSACGSLNAETEPTPSAQRSTRPSAVPTSTRMVAASMIPSSPPTTLPAPTQLPPTLTPSWQPIASSPPTITPRVPLTITLFVVSPEMITPGDPFTLTWRATGGQVTLTALAWNGQMLSQSRSLPLSGSLTMTSERGWRYSHRYVLAVSRPMSPRYVQASVDVKVRCPDDWFFANGPADCPKPAIAGAAAIQHFEHGLMIWLEPLRRIYILYEKSEYRSDMNAWAEAADNFVEGQPESDPDLIPLAGLYQPIRGFGLVWREGYRVRDRLGWATNRETAFQSIWQCGPLPKYFVCYLLQDDGRVIRLPSEHGNWEYWEQP